MGESNVVQDPRALVSFLYELMRDHVPPGVVEHLVITSPAGLTTYTNGHLARYAKELADRLEITATELANEQVQGNKT